MPPDEQDHDHRAGAHQQANHEHPQAGPDHPAELDPGIGLDVDAAGRVGIHHDRGPATELGIPGERLLAGALGLGDPEALLAGWRTRRSALVQVELRVVAVEVDQLVVGDVTEVAIDVVVGPDADEHRFLAIDLDSDVAEDPVRGPVDLVRAEVDVLGGDRVGGAFELLAIRVEVAVVVAAEGVGGHHGDPPDQQRQADQSADAGEDHPDHAARRPVRSRPSWTRGRARGRMLLAAVGHQAQPTWRERWMPRAGGGTVILVASRRARV